jgi:hypothetical protein
MADTATEPTSELLYLDDIHVGQRKTCVRVALGAVVAIPDSSDQ